MVGAWATITHYSNREKPREKIQNFETPPVTICPDISNIDIYQYFLKTAAFIVKAPIILL